MIAWLNPAALWGLAAALGAVLVHLLFRQRAMRLPFPSLRFVQPSFTSATRLRRPADAILLALRVAIVAAAAAALAQPLVMTPFRTRAWNARLARAIVVDTSDSMRPAAGETDDAARAESAHVMTSTRIDAVDLGRGIRDALAWLAAAPPARREIVVISDFQRGGLSEADIVDATPAFGLRFVKVGELPAMRDVEGAAMLNGDRIATSRVHVEGDRTAVEIGRTSAGAAGLDIVAPSGTENDVLALRRIVSAAGTPAPAADEPIVLLLGGATSPGPVQPVRRGWMWRVIQVLRADDEVLGLGQAPDDPRSGGAWVTVLEDPRGEPLIRAAAASQRLVVDVAARPSEFLAAAALRAVLLGRAGGVALDEQEVAAIAPEVLARWTRVPPPLDSTSTGWRQATPDARLCWALALALLAIEGVVRRQRTGGREVRADAA